MKKKTVVFSFLFEYYTNVWHIQINPAFLLLLSVQLTVQCYRCCSKNHSVLIYSEWVPRADVTASLPNRDLPSSSVTPKIDTIQTVRIGVGAPVQRPILHFKFSIPPLTFPMNINTVISYVVERGCYPLTLLFAGTGRNCYLRVMFLDHSFKYLTPDFENLPASS